MDITLELHAETHIEILRLWPRALSDPLQACLRHSCHLILSNLVYVLAWL